MQRKLRVRDAAYDYLAKHPDVTPKQLAKKFDLAGRTSRRYVRNFKEGLAVPEVRLKTTTEHVLLRPAVFDIETTDFGTEGYGGRLILTSILPLGADKPTTYGIRFDDRGNDRRLLEETVEALSKFDILIGHNIAAYDVNWLNSRLMFYGLPPVTSHIYFDTYQVAKALAIKTTKSLGNLLDYFGLEGEKTRIYRTSWLNILSPDEDEFNTAYENIKYHCEQDVIGNRNLFDRLYRYALVNGRANPFKMSKMHNVKF